MARESGGPWRKCRCDHHSEGASRSDERAGTTQAPHASHAVVRPSSLLVPCAAPRAAAPDASWGCPSRTAPPLPLRRAGGGGRQTATSGVSRWGTTKGKKGSRDNRASQGGRTVPAEADRKGATGRGSAARCWHAHKAAATAAPSSCPNLSVARALTRVRRRHDWRPRRARGDGVHADLLREYLQEVRNDAARQSHVAESRQQQGIASGLSKRRRTALAGAGEAPLWSVAGGLHARLWVHGEGVGEGVHSALRCGIGNEGVVALVCGWWGRGTMKEGQWRQAQAAENGKGCRGVCQKPAAELTVQKKAEEPRSRAGAARVLAHS